MNLKRGSILIEVLIALMVCSFIYQIIYNINKLDKIEYDNKTKYEKRI